MDEDDVEYFYDVNDTAVLAIDMFIRLMQGGQINANTYEQFRSKSTYKRMIRSVKNALYNNRELGFELKFNRKTNSYYLYKSNVYDLKKRLY